MPVSPQHGPFSPLPQWRPPWKEFILSLGAQGLVCFLLLWVGVLHPEILVPRARDYHFIRLVDTPPPVNHEPAPVRLLERPPVVVRVDKPVPDNLRLPVHPPKPKLEVDLAPKVEIAARKPTPLPAATPVIPRQPVRTNVFSTGSSATPTIARAPQQVQTGGFGDPNGVPAQPKNGRPVTIAQSGSFDLPSGPGYGNGTGGARGARGVVASAGFGNGVATGDGSSRVSAHGAVRQGGFGDADAAATAQARPKPAEQTPKVLPAEIISKPLPVYTAEARKLRVEGEVLLEVIFEASGQVRVLRVVRGLGHGLDEAAVHAAEQIRFKPALRDGQPADSTAVLHIIFQLA